MYHFLAGFLLEYIFIQKLEKLMIYYVKVCFNYPSAANFKNSLKFETKIKKFQIAVTVFSFKFLTVFLRRRTQQTCRMKIQGNILMKFISERNTAFSCKILENSTVLKCQYIGLFQGFSASSAFFLRVIFFIPFYPFFQLHAQ